MERYNPLCQQRVTSLLVFGAGTPAPPSLPVTAPPPSSSLPVTPAPLPIPPPPDPIPPPSVPPAPPIAPPAPPISPPKSNPPLVPPVPSFPIPPSNPDPSPPTPPSNPEPSPPTPPSNPDLPAPSLAPSNAEQASTEALRVQIFGSAANAPATRAPVTLVPTAVKGSSSSVPALPKQYDTALYRLPVPFSHHSRHLTELYYIGPAGRKFFLNAAQRRQWRQGDETVGCINGSCRGV